MSLLFSFCPAFDRSLLSGLFRRLRLHWKQVRRQGFLPRLVVQRSSPSPFVFPSRPSIPNFSCRCPQSTVKAFEERANCIAEQYSKFYVVGPDGKQVHVSLERGKNRKVSKLTATFPSSPSQVNGNLTNGENIGDFGLRFAWKAWKASLEGQKEEKILPGLPYTAEQMFFLSFGRIVSLLVQTKNFNDQLSLLICSIDLFSFTSVGFDRFVSTLLPSRRVPFLSSLTPSPFALPLLLTSPAQAVAGVRTDPHSPNQFRIEVRSFVPSPTRLFRCR